MSKDVLGKALWNYHKAPEEQELITWTHLTEEDPMTVDYFFRPYEEMPPIEQKALDLAYGSILDIGCGAGSHSLYLQDQCLLDVTAIDIAPAAVATTKDRGVLKTSCIDIFDHNGRYDTLLLLMNGIGMCQNLNGLQELLVHFKQLLQSGGQILLDSSDLIYLFDSDDAIPGYTQGSYYGEVDFGIRYLGEEQLFPWLYVDFETLERVASTLGYQCELIQEGTHYDYLARLTTEY
jgi:SAM-dependent methyltransferase